MNKAWERYFELATSLAVVTRKNAERIVRTLVQQGEIAAERAEEAVDELLKRTERNRHAVAEMARHETERALERFGIGSRPAPPEASETEDAATSTIAKKAAAKKSAPAKKSAAKKSSEEVDGG